MTASRAQTEKRVEKTDEAFRTIGEAASETGLETHVIRYWETRFPRELKPVKRPDGRRLFRPEDMDALRAIQSLVQNHGVTLKHAKRIIDEQGVEAVLSGAAEIEIVLPASNTARALQDQLAGAFASPPVLTADQRRRLTQHLGDLTRLKTAIDLALAAN